MIASYRGCRYCDEDQSFTSGTFTVVDCTKTRSISSASTAEWCDYDELVYYYCNHCGSRMTKREYERRRRSTGSCCFTVSKVEKPKAEPPPIIYNTLPKPSFDNTRRKRQDMSHSKSMRQNVSHVPMKWLQKKHTR